MKLRNGCDQIVRRAITTVQLNAAVHRALEGGPFQDGRVVLAAMGKAIRSVTHAARNYVGGRLGGGIIITKHGYTQGPIGSLFTREAGRPVPDQDTFSATGEALTLTDGLTAEDTVLFLLSDGDSALFEAPLVPQEKLQSTTQSLLASGVDIVKMNIIRRRFPAVKGGRLTQHCASTKIFSIVLPDIIGDSPDIIVSGPVYPNPSICASARRIAEQYGLRLPPGASQCLERETPKILDNVETPITGSVWELYAAVSTTCRELSYEPMLLANSLDCEAWEAGAFLATVARTHQDTERSPAFLAGKETVVHLTGSGLGEHNQELALSAVTSIAGSGDAVVFSLSSDGTDGPTDAAGGFADGGIREQLVGQSVRIFEVLKNNDAYHTLTAYGDLLHTGAAGININDAAMLPIHR